MRSFTSMSSRTDLGVALSWPPRSSTAWTKRACRVVVHRIRGALMLLLVGNLDMNRDRWSPLELKQVVDIVDGDESNECW